MACYAEDRMIRVYFLAVETIDGTDTVVGIEYMRHGILQVEGTGRKLIQDTTDPEHFMLASLAESWREATQDEIDLFDAVPPVEPPDPEYVRVCELLASSSDVITMPEIWDILREFGERLGYRFD